MKTFNQFRKDIDEAATLVTALPKIVMTSTNESVPVRLKDFRTIALA